MKLLIRDQVPNWADVAPRRGAWVETALSTKRHKDSPHVAPRRGAWVETNCACLEISKNEVAPRRGAWVETP